MPDESIPPELSSAPPPLPRKNSGFACSAATASILAPFLAIALGFTLNVLMTEANKSNPTNNPTIVLILAGAATLLMATGLVAGIIAIASHSPDEPRVLVRGVIGVCLNAVFLAAGLYAGVTAKQRAEVRRQNLAEVEKARQELNQNTPESFEKEGYKSDPAKFNNFRKAIEKAGGQVGGVEGDVMKAGAAYLARFQTENQVFSKALTNFLAANVLRVEEIHELDQIAKRRAVTKDFLAANQRMREFVGKAESLFESEMANQNVNEARRAKEMAGFIASGREVNALVQEIRSQDEVICQAALEVLDLLETNWGAWEFFASTKLIMFKEPANNRKYIELGKRISGAAQEQQELQKRLVDLQQAARARKAAKQ